MPRHVCLDNQAAGAAPLISPLLSYFSQLAKMLPIRGELVRRYTSSKYSRVSSNGRAVTLGMYFPTSLLGSMLVLLIFFIRNERNGLTPERRNVEWNGTSMPRSGIVATPRCRSIGCALASV